MDVAVRRCSERRHYRAGCPTPTSKVSVRPSAPPHGAALVALRRSLLQPHGCRLAHATGASRAPEGVESLMKGLILRFSRARTRPPSSTFVGSRCCQFKRTPSHSGTRSRTNLGKSWAKIEAAPRSEEPPLSPSTCGFASLRG